jgi:hypothetical protein
MDRRSDHVPVIQIGQIDRRDQVLEIPASAVLPYRLHPYCRTGFIRIAVPASSVLPYRLHPYCRTGFIRIAVPASTVFHGRLHL